jgi:hypothetical protein
MAEPPPEVRAAVLSHYLSRPDVIRQRAQHAAAIAGAAAAALVAAGGIAELYRYPAWIETLLIAAIVAWLATVAAYMHVVGGHVEPVDPFGADGSLASDPCLLDRVEENAAAVRGSLQTAQRFGQLALALTLIAFVTAAWYAEAQDESVLTDLVVTDEVASAVGTVCGDDSELRSFPAEVRLDDLKAAFIEIRVREPGCGVGEIRIPTDGILAADPR